MRKISILTILVFSCLIVFSCKKNNHLFSYDKVEYYHTDSLFLPLFREQRNVSERLFFEKYVNKYDINLYNDLSKYDYIKEVSKSDLKNKLSLLFTNKKPERNYVDHRCFHFYNDIWFFTKMIR
jgi:hypothetical protein